MVIAEFNDFTLKDVRKTGTMLMLVYGHNSTRLKYEFPGTHLLPLEPHEFITQVKPHQRLNTCNPVGLGGTFQCFFLGNCLFLARHHGERCSAV